MSKNKHHYVPRFYLRNFASEPNRINIFHIEKQLAIPSGSLRDQCYKHKMYGKSDTLEDILSKMESKIAPVIHSILNTSSVLHLNDKESEWLRIFIGLQMTRTAFAAEKINEGVDKLIKLLFSKQAEAKGMDLSKIRVGFENPVMHAMQHFVPIAASLIDLNPHLLINKTKIHFITSDNPIVLYNQYCEGVKGSGTTGALSRGLQIFVPLSPNYFLLFYDSKVYKVNDRDKHATLLTNNEDVRMLNQLSAVNASKVLLFSEWNEESAVRQLSKQISKFRYEETAIAEELVSDDVPSRSFVHFSYQSLNINLDLSFMKLRRRVRKVPKNVRIHEFRDQPIPTGKEKSGMIFRRLKP